MPQPVRHFRVILLAKEETTLGFSLPRFHCSSISPQGFRVAQEEARHTDLQGIR